VVCDPIAKRRTPFENKLAVTVKVLLHLEGALGWVFGIVWTRAMQIGGEHQSGGGASRRRQASSQRLHV
jgi:hypothetical protein